MVVVANKFAIELTGKILLQPLTLDDKLNLRYRNQTATDANRIIHNTQFMSNRWWFRLHMYSATEGGGGVLIPVDGVLKRELIKSTFKFDITRNITIPPLSPCHTSQRFIVESVPFRIPY